MGFVADERRINVGLTRARCSLLVVGNCKALERDDRWGNLIRHAKAARCEGAAGVPHRMKLQEKLRARTCGALVQPAVPFAPPGLFTHCIATQRTIARCLYRATKPFPLFLTSVLDGTTGPEVGLPDKVRALTFQHARIDTFCEFV